MMGEHSARTRGFTLLEMTLSLSILGVLMLAMGGAIIVASKAVPDETSSVQRRPKVARGLGRMMEDLQSATLITQYASDSITFVVPDRDGDGDPEVIHYAWNGPGGAPLVRSINNAAPENIVAALDAFTMNLSSRVDVEDYAAPIIASDEVQLSSFSSGSATADVESANRWSQFFRPNLPVGTTDWTVERVLFHARRSGGASNEELHVQLRVPEADQRPSPTVIDSVTFVEQDDLPNSAAWVEAAYSKATDLSPDAGICIAFTATASGGPDDDSDDGSGAQPARLTYASSGANLAGGSVSQGTPLWRASNTDIALNFYAYGRTTGPGTPGSIRRSVVEAVTILAAWRDEGKSVLESTVRLLNEPLLLSGYWETDFVDDPTKQDVNGDGLSDWRTGDLSAFSLVDLGGKTWYAANDELWTNPICDFTEPTIVEIRAKNAVLGSAAGVVTLNVDRSGTSFGVIEATFRLVGLDTQEVEIHTLAADFSPVQLVTRTISGEWFDLRLLVDPAGDVVNVRLDDEDLGTYLYKHVTNASDPHAIGIYALSGASGALFDRVRITVGGDGTAQGAPGSGTPNSPPAATMKVAPLFATTATPVNFWSDHSSDADGDPMTFAWDFGDGQGAVGESVSHTYAVAGIYEAELAVTDSNGGVGYAHATVVVEAIFEAVR